MPDNLYKITIKSILFYKKPVLYQVLIIALLSAVITGSLLTGRSVRTSLKKFSSEHLGNTGILISSGVRYFNPSLAGKLKDKGINCKSLLQIKGSCQGLNNQKQAFSTDIYAVEKEFFNFHGNTQVTLEDGEIFINRKLADQLQVKTGDELIVRFKEISDIPSDAPFAPSGEAGISMVMKVNSILESHDLGDFSLSISQITPMNIFVNIKNVENAIGKPLKSNRLLIAKNQGFRVTNVTSMLKSVMQPSDIGLTIRKIKATGESEIVSDRIFIDEMLLNEIKKILPSSSPVITYLANSLSDASGSTPYSFISALPPDIYPEIPEGNRIIINQWLSDDLNLHAGDSMKMTWYSPDSLNKLIVRSRKFEVKEIVDMKGIWADSMLMPDFPGIAGRASCSDWDAGVPIKMNEIRNKDENYWNRFRGTPKAFICYTKGRELWGSNFGPATAIRFPEGVTADEINTKLKGSLDPSFTGFTVSDLQSESIKAADESVDFGTLFLSLGFFLILAAIVLLSFVVSWYFDSKKRTVELYFALGFSNRLIKKILFLESIFIGITGCLTGAFAGYFVNVILTMALNSVWLGAVQTSTLDASFSFIPVLTGFAVTFLLMTFFMLIRIRQYLKKLKMQEKEIPLPAARKNFFLFILFTVLTIILYSQSIINKNIEIPMSFGAGASLLVTFIFLWRQFYISARKNSDSPVYRKKLSRLYYSFYPSAAITPILFIAAGIFAVFITSLNRMNFDERQLKRSAGTGGYLLWCESTIPVKEDPNSVTGRKSLGLDEDAAASMNFVTMKRSSGNDASCLNLNHITAPPLLGLDPSRFIADKAFSFAKKIKDGIDDPWQYLNADPGYRTVYGIADQTVLEWGLKLSIGDTLKMRGENGQTLNIIIAAGLKSSVFQGYVIISKESFAKYFPSIPGSSILLVDGQPDQADQYINILNDRLSGYGANVEKTTSRLASFYEVTNTYLSVFGLFGGLGMITGIAGLGFILLRNYNQRKREFALMLATGFSFKRIRRNILSEQMLILLAGVSTGIISAIVATLPSLKGNQDLPWMFLSITTSLIVGTGFLAIFLSLRSISEDSLITSLKKE